VTRITKRWAAKRIGHYEEKIQPERLFPPLVNMTAKNVRAAFRQFPDVEVKDTRSVFMTERSLGGAHPCISRKGGYRRRSGWWNALERLHAWKAYLLHWLASAGGYYPL